MLTKHSLKTGRITWDASAQDFAQEFLESGFYYRERLIALDKHRIAVVQYEELARYDDIAVGIAKFAGLQKYVDLESGRDAVATKNPKVNPSPRSRMGCLAERLLRKNYGLMNWSNRYLGITPWRLARLADSVPLGRNRRFVKIDANIKNRLLQEEALDRRYISNADNCVSLPEIVSPNYAEESVGD